MLEQASLLRKFCNNGSVKLYNSTWPRLSPESLPIRKVHYLIGHSRILLVCNGSNDYKLCFSSTIDEWRGQKMLSWEPAAYWSWGPCSTAVLQLLSQTVFIRSTFKVVSYLAILSPTEGARTAQWIVYMDNTQRPRVRISAKSFPIYFWNRHENYFRP